MRDGMGEKSGLRWWLWWCCGGGCGEDRGSVVHVPLSDRRLGERQS